MIAFNDNKNVNSGLILWHRELMVFRPRLASFRNLAVEDNNARREGRTEMAEGKCLTNQLESGVGSDRMT